MPRLQAKLVVGPAGDHLEQEADQVADQVLRMSAGEGPRITHYAAAPASAGLSQAADIVHRELRAPGQPIDADTRRYFEPRFHRDFGDVRVHTGPQAAESVRAINAVAYTVGRDVVFGAGRYAPASPAGRRLLAHELTHVVQQEGAVPGIQRQTEGLPASSLVASLTEAPHGTTTCTPDQSCAVPAAGAIVADPLTPAEVTRRRDQVRRAARRARSRFPIAAANLEHWVDGGGATRNLPGSIFQRANSGVPYFLENGQFSQYAHLEVMQEGIARRLRLPTTDPSSLLPVGTARLLVYCNSMRANPESGSTAADLSIALGGFTVKSWVTLRARRVGTDGGDRSYQVTVESWRVQICDRYDWIAHGLATMPFPIPNSQLEGLPLPPEAITVTPVPMTETSIVRMDDDWFRQLEANGGGQQFAIYSEIFDAPASLRSALESYTFTNT